MLKGRRASARQRSIERGKQRDRDAKVASKCKREGFRFVQSSLDTWLTQDPKAR
jgi:hypothetical protein